jgi:hypothetical protein
MTWRRAGAGLLSSLTAVGSVALIAFLFMDPIFRESASVSAEDAFTLLALPILAAGATVFASMGALIVRRRPGNRVGWLLMATGLAIVMTFGGFAAGASATAKLGPADPRAGWFSLLGGLAIYPLLAVVGFVGLLFPNGSLPSPRWRWATVPLVAALLASTLIVAVTPGVVSDGLGINPLGSDAFLVAMLAPYGLTLGGIGAFGVIVLAAMAVAVRARRATGIQRQQFKWFLAATALTAIFVPLGFLSSESDPFDVLGMVSISLLPISVGIAILRYRLYEIDRIVSRTLAWGLISVLLAVVFTAGLVGLQALLSGITQDDTLAVAGSTLVTAVLFQPLRVRIQAIVDRRFNRARIDAQLTAQALTARLRTRVELASVTAALEETASAGLGPSHVATWIRRTSP